MSNHRVEDYQDEAGEWRWRVVATDKVPNEDGKLEENIIGVSSEGYKNKDDMVASFFGMFFGDYDDSFLALYNLWDPGMTKIQA